MDLEGTYTKDRIMVDAERRCVADPTEGGSMIFVEDLIEWAKRNAIGRSITHPDGAIVSMDLLRLAVECIDAEPKNYKPKEEDDEVD